MSKETSKKQLRQVTVSISIDGRFAGEEVYRIIVPSDSTSEAEMEWRMEWLKDTPNSSWKITNDVLKNEAECD